MITAVDSSVIFDFVTRDAVFELRSKEALQSSVAAGRVLACDVVWAEVSAYFSSGKDAERMLRELGVEFSPLSAQSAVQAGRAWKVYRQRGGKRTRVTPDFLIGAHALHQADRLLTRDRGFYRAYFKHLSILDPTRQKAEVGSEK